MIFEFVSTSSNSLLSNAASTGLGSVIMATNYDCLDIPFVDKRAMLNNEFASSSKPSISFIHSIECKQSRTPMTMQYVHTSPFFPVGEHSRMYDLANFYIATEGMQNSSNTSVIGKLFVIYELELFKPRLDSFNSVKVPTDIFSLTTMTTSAWLQNALPSPFNTLLGTTGSAVYNFSPNIPNTLHILLHHTHNTLFIFTYYHFPTLFHTLHTLPLSYNLTTMLPPHTLQCLL